MMTRVQRTAAILGALLVVAVGVLLVMRPGAPPSPQAAVNTSASALTVELIAPDIRNWPQTLRASGAVAAWEEVVIGSEIGGLRIAELAVNIGERVTRGQLLARLSDDTARAELDKQEALVAQAQASLKQAEGDLNRAQAVDVAGAIAPQKLDEYRAIAANARASLASAQADLQSARLKLAQTRIVAPDAGIVASKSGIVGNVASVGTELYRLIRQGRLEWRAELDARQLAWVREGQSSSVELPDAQAIEGRVRLVSPTISSANGRGLVYVSLPPGSAAKAGVFASGAIRLPELQALTLPEAAVVLRDGRSYVYVLDDASKVMSRVVTTGRRQDGRVEVTSGVETTSRVVAKGGAFLSEGALVTVVSNAAANNQGARP